MASDLFETKAVAPNTKSAAVREKETVVTPDSPETYEEVVYCSVCHKELSRQEKIGAAFHLNTVSLGKITNKKKRRVTLHWTQSEQATGYEIQYSTSKNFKKSTKLKRVKNPFTTKLTLKGLKKQKNIM